MLVGSFLALPVAERTGKNPTMHPAVVGIGPSLPSMDERVSEVEG